MHPESVVDHLRLIPLKLRHEKQCGEEYHRQEDNIHVGYGPHGSTAARAMIKVASVSPLLTSACSMIAFISARASKLVSFAVVSR